jgi:hypothetical protein
MKLLGDFPLKKVGEDIGLGSKFKQYTCFNQIYLGTYFKLQSELTFDT